MKFYTWALILLLGSSAFSNPPNDHIAAETIVTVAFLLVVIPMLKTAHETGRSLRVLANLGIVGVCYAGMTWLLL